MAQRHKINRDASFVVSADILSNYFCKVVVRVGYVNIGRDSDIAFSEQYLSYVVVVRDSV
jgi:hypothetical protein